MSDPFEERLHDRLERLSDAIPVPEPGAEPGRGPGPRSGRVTLRGVVLAGTLLLLVSLAGTAAILRLDQPYARGSAFAPGGPLHCAGVDQLSPREAERWLHERGFDVTWQLEGDAAGTSTQQDAAPDHGTITTVLVTGEGQLLVLVDLTRATPLAPRPCP